MAADPEVRLATKCMVAPATPTSTRHLYLSPLDIFWRDIHYNKRVLFYEGAGKNSVEILKKGLAEVLVPYYPFAGRLALDEHQRLEIQCNDAGAEFVEAAIELPLWALKQQGFQMRSFFEKLCQDVQHKGEFLYTCPLLSVQVTRFTDGGLAVAVAINHVVADGQSLWDFMVAWGEYCRGQNVRSREPPVHDRRLLALRDGPSKEKAKVEVTVFGIEEDGESGRVSNDLSTDGLSWEDAMFTNPDALVQCLFILPETAVAKLKAAAGGGYSSYVVTCAHFWQRVSVARDEPASAETFLGCIANLRSRFGLPSTYFGNAIFGGVSSTTVGRVTTESLSLTAKRIQTAVKVSQDMDRVNACMQWLELHDHQLGSEMKVRGLGINVASSPRFPAYSVDFGWGRPAAVRSVRVAGNGEMVLFGGRPDLAPGDIEVCLPLSAGALRRLLHDEEFLAYTPVSPFI